MFGVPLWPIDWQGKWGGRKSPVNCPRCGMRMLTHTVYYECPGCGHMLELPATQPRMSYQPIDSVAYKLRQVLDDDMAEPPDEFASLVPNESFDAERGKLLVTGGALWLVLAAWIFLDATPQYGVRLPLLLHMICNGLLCAAIFPAIALLASSARYKQACAVLSLLLAPCCIYIFYYLLNHPDLWAWKKPDLLEWMAPLQFLAWAAYFVWLAFFLAREARNMRNRN